MDPITAGASLVASDEAKSLLSRVLGPSADVAGEYLSSLLKARLDNAHKVAKAAERRLRPGVDLEPVPMRVALRALDEGSYSDDEIVTEYVGGILASSRMARDSDVANTYVAMVSRLSTTHLLVHYHLYHAIKSVTSGWVNVFDANEVEQRLAVHIEADEIERVLGGSWAEDDGTTELFSVLKYLEREGLINVKSGGALEHLQRTHPAVQAAGVIVEPTVTGIELFMWGLGHGDRGVVKFFEVSAVDARIQGLDKPTQGKRANPEDTMTEGAGE